MIKSGQNAFEVKTELFFFFFFGTGHHTKVRTEIFRAAYTAFAKTQRDRKRNTVQTPRL